MQKGADEFNHFDLIAMLICCRPSLRELAARTRGLLRKRGARCATSDSEAPGALPPSCIISPRPLSHQATANNANSGATQTGRAFEQPSLSSFLLNNLPVSCKTGVLLSRTLGWRRSAALLYSASFIPFPFHTEPYITIWLLAGVRVKLRTSHSLFLCQF